MDRQLPLKNDKGLAKECCPTCGKTFDPVQEWNNCGECHIKAEELITGDDDYAWCQ